ncbi:MAG: hypothetical protein ACOCP8_03365 [archaeon]
MKSSIKQLERVISKVKRREKELPINIKISDISINNWVKIKENGKKVFKDKNNPDEKIYIENYYKANDVHFRIKTEISEWENDDSLFEGEGNGSGILRIIMMIINYMKKNNVYIYPYAVWSFEGCVNWDEVVSVCKMRNKGKLIQK